MIDSKRGDIRGTDLSQELADLRREGDRLVANERVWIADATRLAGDGVAPEEDVPNENLFDTAFFLRYGSMRSAASHIPCPMA
ncbi:MAG: hypothetical protein PF508_15470 [Spirochaeta sp.]|jgi:hypothetical protein|nr:hypothetical protein [Spirochaeta sp.]